MGRPTKNRPARDMSPKYDYVCMRRPQLPAAQSQGGTVSVMVKKGQSGAPQSIEAFNKFINGRESVNMAWLTLLSQAFELDKCGIDAEAWYRDDNVDFFDKVDRCVCARPLDNLEAWVCHVSPKLSLDIERTSPNWRLLPPPATVREAAGVQRAAELGTPPLSLPLATVAPGDGVSLRFTLAWPAYVTVINVDWVAGDASVHVLTPFTSASEGVMAAGEAVVRRQDGQAIPIGRRHIGLSRWFVVATRAPLQPTWSPRSDGRITLPELRSAVISLMSLQEINREVMAHDYRTIETG